MSSESKITFTRLNLELYIKEVAKEYRRLGGKAFPAEMILIGGASVLVNYDFREMTADIDAEIHAAPTIKEAINNVADKYGLPNGWINDDFRCTGSYTPGLAQFSHYFKTFYGVLSVRTISAEYLIAMKLKAGRQYKNDLSDVVGILAAHEKRNDPVTMEMIRNAVKDLYGDWDMLPESSRNFIEDVFMNGDYLSQAGKIKAEEKATRDDLIEFERNYTGTVNPKNVEYIIAQLKRRRNTGK